MVQLENKLQWYFIFNDKMEGQAIEAILCPE